MSPPACAEDFLHAMLMPFRLMSRRLYCHASLHAVTCYALRQPDELVLSLLSSWLDVTLAPRRQAPAVACATDASAAPRQRCALCRAHH